MCNYDKDFQGRNLKLPLYRVSLWHANFSRDRDKTFALLIADDESAQFQEEKCTICFSDVTRERDCQGYSRIIFAAAN